MEKYFGDGLRKMLGLPIEPKRRTYQQPAAAPAATQPHLTATMGDGLKALIKSATNKKDKK